MSPRLGAGMVRSARGRVERPGRGLVLGSRWVGGSGVVGGGVTRSLPAGRSRADPAVPWGAHGLLSGAELGAAKPGAMAEDYWDQPR